MKIVIQRVKMAQVKVDGIIVGEIKHGMLVLIGIENNSDREKIAKTIHKILEMRLWPEGKKGFEKNVVEICGGILAVSQFTLMANVKKGNRPSFTGAMDAKEAKIIYNEFIEKLKQSYKQVAEGKFQAMMTIEMINDGPVTIVFDV